MAALEGVGSETAGQWEEWSGVAYHIRRRLSADEERLTGPAVDLRNTPEGVCRYQAAVAKLPESLKSLAAQEVVS